MRFIRFSNASHEATFGVVQEDGLVRALRGDPLADFEVAETIAPISDVRLLAPCRPPKLVCIAINFPGIEGFTANMQEPLVFVKPGTSVTDPEAVVTNPFPGMPWWGEAELGVVIGKRIGPGDPIEPEESVFGFTVGNDTTVDNVEGRDHHLARSKCPDSFCSLGPWIETELDTSDLLIEAIQDGEIIRSGRTSEQFWKWPEIIRRVSSWMTLEPWDVVLTGNPPDCAGMRFLGTRADYLARVEGIGTLANSFES